MSNFIGQVTETIKRSKSGDYQYWTIKTPTHEGSMASKKDECYVQVGDMIEYNMDTFKNGSPKISIINKNDYIQGSETKQDHKNEPVNRNSSEVQAYIIRQSSLQRAVEICIANGLKPDINMVCATADVLTSYVLTGQIPAKKKTNPVTGQPANSQQEIDELPF